MGIRESINLFNSKINQTLWTRQELSPKGKILKTVTNPVVLPVENYYKLLQKRGYLLKITSFVFYLHQIV